MIFGFAAATVFITRMPSTSYRVAVTVTSIGPIAGSTGTCEDLIDGCIYFQVSNKTTTSFRITARSTETGGLAYAPTTYNLDWILIQDVGQTGQQAEDQQVPAPAP